MADTTFADETTTGRPAFVTGLVNVAKRVFAALIEAREREAQMRIKAVPPLMRDDTGGSARRI